MYDIRNVKDYPEFKPLFKAMGYRKKSFGLAIIEAGEKSTGPAWWEGGSRTQYFIADRRANVSAAPCIDNPFEFKRDVGYPKVIIDDDTGEEKLGGVWDYREDDEGMFFGEDMINLEKAKAIEELRQSKIEARKNNPYNVPVNDDGIQII